MISLGVAAAMAALTVSAVAGNARDVKMIPSAGRNAADFAPKGWVVEDFVQADVTNDGVKDLVIKLVEDKPKAGDEAVERARILVIASGTTNGPFLKVAATDKILQCTACGGAFYGVADASADISVERGVIVISQESGSRWVMSSTYRFRYDPRSKDFVLIGFDYSNRDRAEGSIYTESTNYLTGKRITETGKGNRMRRKAETIRRSAHSIKDVDAAGFEAAAARRLGI